MYAVIKIAIENQILVEVITTFSNDEFAFHKRSSIIQKIIIIVKLVLIAMAKGTIINLTP